MPEYLLKGTRKVLIEIDVFDLDDAITKFIKSKYYSDKNFDRHGYESIAENEWCNDESHTFTVQPEVSTKELDDMSTRDLLNVMCAEGLVEPGEYLVEISW